MTATLRVVRGAVVRLAGAADAPPLVLLHAFADTGYSYDGVVASGLLKDYRLIVPDLWGFGASPPDPGIAAVADYGVALMALIDEIAPNRRVGLVGHSISAAIAVAAAAAAGDKVAGLFSIEGNLTPDDAFFTGKAADFDDPQTFKERFLEDIWEMGRRDRPLRHYYSGAAVADARTLWALGRDAKHISADNRLGDAYRSLTQPTLYYWSQQSTPDATQRWISGSGIAHQEYRDAGHWPMVEQPVRTATAIRQFFDTVF